MVRVAVDQGACIGAGTCELLEPEVFAIDDDTSLAAYVIADDRASVEASVIAVNERQVSQIGETHG